MRQRHGLFALQIVIDLATLAAALFLAFQLRFDWNVPTEMWARFLVTAPLVVLVEYATMLAFGVQRLSWRYFGLAEAFPMLKATLASTALLALVRSVLVEVSGGVGAISTGVVPLGALAINCVMMFGLVVSVRGARRTLAERTERKRHGEAGREKVRTMLVGAGQCGVLMVRELKSRPDLGFEPVGFVDDDIAKLGLVVQGVRVLGPIRDLERLCREHGAKQVLITIAGGGGQAVREIVALCERAQIPAKIIPGLYELADGAVNISRIRDVAIEDLLGRDAVTLDLEALGGLFRHKRVLVTGAGGSIGSELCRQLMRFAPAELQLVERAENALFQIHRELEPGRGETTLVPLIADVTDKARIEQLFRDHKPELVFHAAAHKHVPMMEWNPGEALKNNVGGTATVADASHRHGVERFVMISTDKAVNPSSVMGATKRIAEMYVQSLASESATRFATVRFGNVLGSAGSVIPIFREQIQRGGPVCVTHPEMRRYFMTIPEACQLVLQSATMGNGGEIFVLDMGEPVRIVDLAHDLIRLSGLKPGVDIEVEFTGTRPGEKLFEEIATDAEQAEKTRHPKIFVGRTRSPQHERVATWVRELPDAVAAGDKACVALITRCVPEFRATEDSRPRAGAGLVESSSESSAREPERTSLVELPLADAE